MTALAVIIFFVAFVALVVDGLLMIGPEESGSDADVHR
jgi:hypothetical protein